MSLPISFANQVSAQMDWLDQNFDALGNIDYVPGTVTGTNAIVFTGAANAPAISGYIQQQGYSFIAAATNTGAVTFQVTGLSALSCYKAGASGPTPIEAGDIRINGYYVAVYDTALNGGAGGFHIFGTATVPNPTTTVRGGVLALNSSPSQFVVAIATSGQPQTAQVMFSNLGGAWALSQLPSAGTRAGELLIGTSGSGLSVGTLTAGMNVVITSGDGIINISATLSGTGFLPVPTISNVGQELQVDTAGAAFQFVGPLAGFKNRLYNPDGAINQRQGSALSDDLYGPDRWYVLTQTSGISYSQLTSPETGFPFGIRFTQASAAAQRFGFSQIIENVNCLDLAGQPVVLTPRVRCSVSGAQIRTAVLCWTGSGNAVTSDVVNDWPASTFTTGSGNFFIGTNISVVAVGSATPSADTWTTLPSVAATILSSMTNLIVFAWTGSGLAQNATLDFDYVQLERGSVATAFDRRPFGAELELCQRYYEKTFALATAPAQEAGINSAGILHLLSSGTNGLIDWRFLARKRTTPTITTYNPAQPNANFRNESDTVDVAVTVDNVSEVSARLRNFGGFTDSVTYQIHATASAEL